MNDIAMVLFTVLAAALVIDVVYVLIKMIPLIKRLREVKHVRESHDVISVEGEILEVNEERLNQWDIQYDIKVCYIVGYEKYYKDIVLINKQSIRTGQKITLLCNSDDPENAVIQTEDEMSMLKSHIFNLILAIIGLIVYMLMNIWRWQNAISD
ncbi:MAG: hypothetical protein K2N38_11650 [Oscillospiraceae bacterium]|nr:hypothetical protein [Oscillospiraceae bacterium]